MLYKNEESEFPIDSWGVSLIILLFGFRVGSAGGGGGAIITSLCITGGGGGIILGGFAVFVLGVYASCEEVIISEDILSC